MPGAALPDYELSDHRGKRRKLSELQGGDPLVVVLSRGGFCPKERRQHESCLIADFAACAVDKVGGRLHRRKGRLVEQAARCGGCLLYTSPSPRD